MNNQLTDSAPVTDEDLDHMILGLERDGIYPKLLSLMRELRERRKASGDPAYYVISDDDGIEINTVDEFSCGRRGGQPLYTAPPTLAFRDLSQPVDPQIAEYEELMSKQQSSNPPVTMDGLTVAANSGIPIISSGWTPVSERMPNSDDVLLYCSDSREQFVGFHRGDGVFQFFFMEGTEGVCKPTHWQPLPEPPVK